MQRLLPTAMITSWAALGEKADAQIKLLEEYFCAQRHGAAPVSGSTSAKFGALGPSLLLSTRRCRISSLRFLERRGDFRGSLVRIAITPVLSRLCSCNSAWIQEDSILLSVRASMG